MKIATLYKITNTINGLFYWGIVYGKNKTVLDRFEEHMSGKGGTGIELNLENVPQREQNMTPYEIMLSESQERMLMIIKPEREDFAQKIFEKWGLDFAVIGKVTNTGRVVIKMQGEVYADIPSSPLSDSSPEYDRPWI